MTDTPTPSDAAQADENHLIAERRRKLAELRAAVETDGDGSTAFPNDFRRDAVAEQIHAMFGSRSAESLEERPHAVRIAGRMMSQRLMGKASFADLQDGTGRIQLFVRKNDVGEQVFDDYKTWDVGDQIAATGRVFRTKTGELSVWVDSVRLLTKSLRPLPEKWAGLTDTEARYRQRYVDLIMNPDVRDTFFKRTQIIKFIRSFFDTLGFLEVETPMLQAQPGGAAAKPFITHYNVMDRDYYLRIAPELFLKRLVVGGFERVYEINRNFRNEGLSTRHNPEFTMLEFYQAYADYNDLMDLTENLVRDLAESICGTTTVAYQGEDYDLAQPFARLSVRDALLQYNEDLDAARLDDAAYLREVLQAKGVDVPAEQAAGKLQFELFEHTVEDRLMQPTFITQHPVEVSPLARRNDANPAVTDRFEFYIAGRELANGFSELNDAEDQAERFSAQVAAKAGGDDEAMAYDEDFVRALEIGLPPTAGEGIGIDRLVMFLTDSASIRDVLLFPQLRPVG